MDFFCPGFKGTKEEGLRAIVDAVYHFKGIPQLLFMVYQEIFCRWLSRTENELDERPIIDIYRKVEESGYMEIDICFPLKTRAV